MRAGWILGAASGVLAGCAAVPVTTPDVRLPAAFEAPATAAATPPATPSPAALDRWWTLFDDAELNDLVATALVHSPDARSAFERVAEARAGRAQTLAAYLPQGDLAASAQDQHSDSRYAGVSSATSGLISPSGDLQSYGASFQVSYALDLFGRQRAARHGADAAVAAARFDAEAVRTTLARDVATSLFQARGAAIALENAQETQRIARDLARSAAVSASHGLTSTSDAARLETDEHVAAAEVARLQGLVRTDTRSLLTLVGRGADAASSVVIAAVEATPPAPPLLTPATVLMHRPDVREAQANLASATAALKLDRLALLPSFSLAPGGQYSQTEGVYALTSSIWSIGLAASLPVLDRPRLLAQIHGQHARADEAAIAYEKAVQDAYRDAENGLASVAADAIRVQALTRAVGRARFAFDAKKRGYDLGLVDLTTLLDAERSWRTNLSTLTSAQTLALVDSATLFQALGGGWTPPPGPYPPTFPVALATNP